MIHDHHHGQTSFTPSFSIRHLLTNGSCLGRLRPQWYQVDPLWSPCPRTKPQRSIKRFITESLKVPLPLGKVNSLFTSKSPVLLVSPSTNQKLLAFPLSKGHPCWMLCCLTLSLLDEFVDRFCIFLLSIMFMKIETCCASIVSHGMLSAIRAVEYQPQRWLASWQVPWSEEFSDFKFQDDSEIKTAFAWFVGMLSFVRSPFMSSNRHVP